MPGRLPTKNDGIPGTYIIIPPPSGHPPTNILIVLHGLGDTHTPFQAFAQKLQLPETACIVLKGGERLPFDFDGAHWGDDIVFDETSGSIDIDTGFKKSTCLLLQDVIRKVLLEKCGYTTREILLFGFGQGGMLALNVAAELGHEQEFGGIVSIGAALPSTARLPKTENMSKTPILVCRGYRRSSVAEEDVDKLKAIFKFVNVETWRRSGDGMPASRDEMLPIMRFWARRLKSRRGVPEGSVELT